MIRSAVAFLACVLSAIAAPLGRHATGDTVQDSSRDPSLVGAWKAVTYEVNGVAHPMQGLFIFTSTYYSANVRFRLGDAAMDDANGNAGPYSQSGHHIVFKQWVQVHVRPADRNQPILSREGPDEASDYQLDQNRMTLTFPSGNRYILERIAE
jgi:hypothetical protein